MKRNVMLKAALGLALIASGAADQIAKAVGNRVMPLAGGHIDNVGVSLGVSARKAIRVNVKQGNQGELSMQVDSR